MKKALYIICLFFVSVLFAEEFSYGDFLYKIKVSDIEERGKKDYNNSRKTKREACE